MTKCYILIENNAIKKKLINFFNSNDISYLPLTQNDIDSITSEDFSHNALFIDSKNLAKYSERFNDTNAPLLHTILIQNINAGTTLAKKHTNVCDLIIDLPLNQAKLKKIYSFVNKFNTLDLNNRNIDTFDYGDYYLQGTSQVLNTFKQELKNVAKSTNNICITGGIGTEKVRVLNYIVDKIRAKGEKLLYLRCQKIMNSENPKQALTAAFRKILSSTTGQSLIVIYQPYHFDEELQKTLHALLSKNDKNQYITISQYSISALEYEYNFNKELLTLLTQSAIEVPVLANRKHDIPHIVDYLKNRLINIYGCQEIKFSTTALITLQSYQWLGNYIELRNIVESLMINAVENQIEVIESKDLPSDLFIVNQASLNPAVNYDIMSKDLKEARSIFEKQYIEAQIRRFGGNVSHTANFIGMERTALHRKLAFLGILSDEVRSSIKGYKRGTNS